MVDFLQQSEFLKESNLLQVFLPENFQWRNSIIEMDRAFVTPRIVTQARSLLIETYGVRLTIAVRRWRYEHPAREK